LQTLSDASISAPTSAFLSKQLLSASNISPGSPVFSLCDAHDGN